MTIEEIILAIIGIGVSAVALAIALIIHSKQKVQSDEIHELTKEIHETVDKISSKLIETSGKPIEQITTKEDLQTPGIEDTPGYLEKVSKCIDLLKDTKWVWRSDVILMRKSGLNLEQFNHFVSTDNRVVKSKIPDIHGNRLFTLESKLSHG